MRIDSDEELKNAVKQEPRRHRLEFQLCALFSATLLSKMACKNCQNDTDHTHT